MSQKQKLWGPVSTIPVTASGTLDANKVVKEGNIYGVPVDAIASGDKGVLHVRGVFEQTKSVTAEVIAIGDFIEYVSAGIVRKHDQGVKIGKAYEASGGTTATVLVELMPELY